LSKPSELPGGDDPTLRDHSARAASLCDATKYAAAHAADALGAAPFDSTFLQSTSLIFLSEIGDKTFFIASILAAKASRLVTFVGSFGALALMTVISVLIGQIFHAVPESVTGGLPLDDYVAVASFVYFGVRSIADALATEEPGEGMADELADAEEVLASGDVLEKTRGKAARLAGEAFALTVAAEVGDRSQLATIALSAAQNPYLVCAGACFGHGLATGIAVVGGAFISKYTNEKTVGLIGGVLFLVFAATTACLPSGSMITPSPTTRPCSHSPLNSRLLGHSKRPRPCFKLS